jgi:membrane associated rhomboid family serine protease
MEGPITTWGKIPIYITTIILGIQVLGLLLGILWELSHFPVLALFISGLAFYPEDTFKGFQIWRLVTYLFIDRPNFFSLFALCFMWFYGREVENYLGRVRTITFFLILTYVPVVVGTLCWLIGFNGIGLAGTYNFSIGVILAFATLYPRMEWMFGIQWKYFAWASVVLGAMGPLQQQDASRMPTLLMYAAACLGAWGYIRWLQMGGETPEFNFGKVFKRRPKLKVVRGGNASSAPAPVRQARESQVENSFKPGGSVPQAVVDQILEKVGKEGIGSLSAKERQLLEKHSTDLKKRAGR